MRNFPFNTLGMAQSVIGKQAYQIEEWAGRVRNANGKYVNSYSESVTRHASVQPLSSEKKTLMGLTMTANYITIFDVDLIGILSRTENPPRVVFNGYYWTPEAPSSDWNAQGGWNKVVAVRGAKVAA